jgi:acetylornithine deacetylase/succinyl-diaminopimelate desuccinylase-like protein
MTDLNGYIDREMSRFQEELFEFLRIPSVSARSEHDQDVRKAAAWVADRIRDAGLSATVVETPGHPVVLGEWKEAGPEAPTFLVYGHYDVQPPEPLAEWKSPAFEPTVRDGNLFARGASDDKGQLFLHIKALEAQLRGTGSLPVNVWPAMPSSSPTLPCSPRAFPLFSSPSGAWPISRSMFKDPQETFIQAPTEEP